MILLFQDRQADEHAAALDEVKIQRDQVLCLFCLGSFFLLSRLASYIQCSMSLVPSSSRAGLGSSADDIFVTSISILGCGEGVSVIVLLTKNCQLCASVGLFLHPNVDKF